jgi:hypothetical protein
VVVSRLLNVVRGLNVGSSATVLLVLRGSVLVSVLLLAGFLRVNVSLGLLRIEESLVVGVAVQSRSYARLLGSAAVVGFVAGVGLKNELRLKKRGKKRERKIKKASTTRYHSDST